MVSSAKVLFLAFDACDPDVARAMAAAGEMPNLARLLQHGAHARVEQEPGLFVGAIWPTVATGIGVGRHGFYTGIRMMAGSYEYIPAGVQARPLWSAASDAGKRVAALDVPFFPVEQGLNGVQLVEWGCHDRYYGTGSWPTTLVDEINAEIGSHPIGTVPYRLERFAPCDVVHRSGTRRTADERVALWNDLLASWDRKAKVSLNLLDRGEWDLFYNVVGETHCAGHHFWSVHDESHPEHDPALRDQLGRDPVTEMYRRADCLLGEHLDRLDDSATAYVLFSHGMTSHFDGTQLLDEILIRLERNREGLHSPIGPRTARLDRSLGRLGSRLRRRVLRGTAPLVRRALGRRSTSRTETTPLPPPAERLLFRLENNTVSGAVRMNLAGREPEGRVGVTHRVELERWLMDRLAEIVNLDTGQPAISAVLRSSDLYPRSGDDGLPDLLIEWNHSAPIERVWSPTIGTITIPYEGERSGDHTSTGLLLAFGPGLTPRTMRAISGADVAPTIAAALGLEMDQVDGVVVPHLVPPERRMQRTGRRLVRRRSAQRRSIAHERQTTGDSSALAALRVDLASTRAELESMRRDLAGLLGAHHETRQLASQAMQAADVAVGVMASTSWLTHVDVTDGVLISVVIATRNRAQLLERAIQSVLDQTYAEFEVVVVDDASDDDTPSVVAAFRDPRMISLRNDVRRGESGARNVGLERASGAVVTYLDDDNYFDPQWLRAVAWLFTTQPTARVAYGARIVDDVERHHSRGEGGMPWMQLNPWDREAARSACPIDVNVIAHRRSELRFDEQLTLYPDWDLLLGLTAETDPIRLPVIAAYYTTTASDRASQQPREIVDASYRYVIDKWSRVNGR